MSINKKKLLAYLELTKPRILLLVLITTALGYYLAAQGIPSYLHFFWLLLGSGLVCGGSSTLNHFLEREYDAKMDRTKSRPLPSKTLTPSEALNFGVILVLSGIIILQTQINLLTAFISLLTCFLYIVIYTPLKRMSWLNTTVGAIPGALPPMGGWTAATGEVDYGAWVLFTILFLWQHPHFYAIGWLYKEDYKKGGYQMLPCIDKNGEMTFFQIFVFSLLLVPISLIPSFIGLTGRLYFFGAAILGIGMFFVSQIFINTQSDCDARKLLRATVIYLPLLFILIICDVQF